MTSEDRALLVAAQLEGILQVNAEPWYGDRQWLVFTRFLPQSNPLWWNASTDEALKALKNGCMHK
jgi:hypothetical protein